MAKSRNSGKLKQDAIIGSLRSTIRQEETREWTKISERIGTANRPTVEAKPRISFYQPNNPLNGIRTNAQLKK
jgi:hypothetical protein